MVAAVLLIGSYYDVLTHKYLIVLRGTSFDEAAVRSLLDQYHRKNRVRSVNREATHMELVCEVTGRKGVEQELMESLRTLPGVTGADWLLETGTTTG